MERGYAVPLILILVLAILIVPVIFWISTNSVNLSSSTPEVRGAVSVSGNKSSKGFSVTVTANNADTWDLIEYLCQSVDECVVSIDSGRQWGIVSGGKSDLHEVVVNVPNDWQDYDYIKYFVRSGWFGDNRGFKVVSAGNVPGSEVYTIEDAGVAYEVVVTPLDPLYNGFYQSAHFSD